MEEEEQKMYSKHDINII